MRRLVALILAVAMTIMPTSILSEEADSSSLSAETTTHWNGFRGVDWGAGIEEIIAAEGREPDHVWDETPSVSYVDVPVSKFTEGTAVGYMIPNNSLHLAEYVISSENPATDCEYMYKALVLLYGEPSEQVPIEVVNAITNILGAGPTESDLENMYCWLVENTGILLSEVSTGVLIVYVDTQQQSVAEEEILTNGL